jgi:hypothetical protein
MTAGDSRELEHIKLKTTILQTCQRSGSEAPKLNLIKNICELKFLVFLIVEGRKAEFEYFASSETHEEVFSSYLAASN